MTTRGGKIYGKNDVNPNIKDYIFDLV